MTPIRQPSTLQNQN